MHTIAPTHSAIGAYMSPVHPSATNSRQVRISAAIVIPEMGFDDDPIRPVIREDTVAKKKPKIRMRMAATILPWVGNPGVTARKIASSTEPPSTTAIGMSRSVLVPVPAVAAAEKSRRLPLADATIDGIVRASVINPAASTPPAPMYRMYALHS